MVRFSCFQAHIHFHKHKKTVRLSDEIMEKSSDDSTANHNLGSVVFSPTERKTCSKEDGDSPYTGDRLTNSSPTERECKSEEIEAKYNTDSSLMAANNAPIRKCQSLGSGMNLAERSYGAEGEKVHKLSSDRCAGNRALLVSDEINNRGLGVIDQLQELVLPDSIRVNSKFVKDMSMISIGNPQYHEEVDANQDDMCLSDGFKSDDCAPQIQAVIAKSRSLPTMNSPTRCSPSFLQCSRSVEDLHGLECKKNLWHESVRQTRGRERDDSVFDNDKVHEENPADDACETYKYVGSAKDWIMPALDVVTADKGKKAETSLCCPDEVPPKDFRLKRIDDWVNDLQHYTPLEDSNEFAPFDGSESSKGRFVLDESIAVKSDVKINPGAEAAKKYVSSLNASAASAQLTNLGLVAIPFLSAFVSLKALNLSGNAIVRITAGALPRGLHILNLSKNSISTIEGLRDLTRLRVLDLSYNRIVRIGHGLSSCSSLKELYLAGNKISEVEGLHRLLKLNILDLRFNKISTTKCLGQLAANYSCLQALSLEGNPCQKNVSDEQLKKYVLSLLPHLTYYNRKNPSRQVRILPPERINSIEDLKAKRGNKVRLLQRYLLLLLKEVMGPLHKNRVEAEAEMWHAFPCLVVGKSLLRWGYDDQQALRNIY